MPLYLAIMATAGSFTDGFSLKNPRQKDAALPYTKRQPPVLLPAVLHSTRFIEAFPILICDGMLDEVLDFIADNTASCKLW